MKGLPAHLDTQHLKLHLPCFLFFKVRLSSHVAQISRKKAALLLHCWLLYRLNLTFDFGQLTPEKNVSFTIPLCSLISRRISGCLGERASLAEDQPMAKHQSLHQSLIYFVQGRDFPANSVMSKTFKVFLIFLPPEMLLWECPWTRLGLIASILGWWGSP